MFSNDLNNVVIHLGRAVDSVSSERDSPNGSCFVSTAADNVATCYFIKLFHVKAKIAYFTVYILYILKLLLTNTYRFLGLSVALFKLAVTIIKI